MDDMTTQAAGPTARAACCGGACVRATAPAPSRESSLLATRLRAGRSRRAADDIYQPTARRRSVSALRDRQAAEDVQQQVYTEVWRRAGEYDPSAPGC